jgi:hypothetical protein
MEFVELNDIDYEKCDYIPLGFCNFNILEVKKGTLSK